MRLLLGLLITAGLVVGIYFAVASLRTGNPKVHDPFPVAKPAAEGFAPRFEQVMNRIPQQHRGIWALLVARHGKLVFEGYYHDYPYNTGFEMYSITKSVTSALVGIAMHEQRIKRLNQTVGTFFPRWTPPRARKITLRELLTMTSGWPGDNDPRNDVGPGPPNLVQAIINRPIVHRAGEFDYDSSSTHVLSAVLTKVTGLDEQRYAEKVLFGPLGIAVKDVWPKDQNGITFGGNGLTLLARDAVKLGQLYLQHGRWHGRQIVPRKWVAESTAPHVVVRGAHGYGYGWWTTKRKGANEFLGIGYGGQVLGVVPKLDLIVAAFSDPAYPEVAVDSLLNRVEATIRN